MRAQNSIISGHHTMARNGKFCCAEIINNIKSIPVEAVVLCWRNKTVDAINKARIPNDRQNKLSLYQDVPVYFKAGCEKRINSSEIYNFKLITSQRLLTVPWGTFEIAEFSIKSNNNVNIDHIITPIDAIKFEKDFSVYYNDIPSNLSTKRFESLDIKRLYSNTPFPAFALTIHRVQGQTLKNIVVHKSDLQACYDKEFAKKLHYTAVSRASKELRYYVDL